MQPKLTVIIPTRNRPDTLAYSLKTVTCQPCAELEIIVSDNGDTPSARPVVEANGDARVRYIRPEGVLGMSEHWEFALGHAAGEWIGFLGDDDGLLPDAVAFLLQSVSAHRGARAFGSKTGKFFWPDTTGGKASRLMVPLEDGVFVRASDEAISAVMEGDEPFTILPCIYTGGFLQKSLIDDIKARSGGKFFMSMIPDTYSGIAAALNDDAYLYSNRIISVAGVSSHSNGFSQARWKKEDARKIEFFKTTTIGFNPKLGNGVVNTAQILVYESWLRAAHLDRGKRDFPLKRQLSLSILYAQKGRRGDVVEYCRNVADLNGFDFREVRADLVKLAMARKATKLFKNLKRLLLPGKYKRYVRINGDSSIADIAGAVQRADEVIRQARTAG